MNLFTFNINPKMKTPETQSSTVLSSTPKIQLMDLPTELHLQISQYLTYPDALSLKHTNRHFYGFVYTGINLKVEWLLKRRGLHLDCPHDRACELGSDTRFCRGSVRFVHPLFILSLLLGVDLCFGGLGMR